MTGDRSWLHETPEPILAENDAREARIVTREQDTRRLDAPGLSHDLPLDCYDPDPGDWR